MKKKVHVISGTHWDREWRYTAEASRLRLAELLDSLIELMENDPQYRFFHLDGGTITLEDYLALRPERQERLRHLIQDGRILLVNWYTLPDLYIVAPEAAVRNLLIGRQVARPFGGTMRAGYSATSYGQPSQVPQIFRGFGLHNIMFYRGLNKYAVPPYFRWQAPDGSELRVMRCFDVVTRTNWFFYVHQPLCLGKEPKDLSYKFKAEEMPVHVADQGGYETDFQLLQENEQFARDPEALKKAFTLLMEQIKSEEHQAGNHLLALNMEDNQKPYAPLEAMIRALNEVQQEAEFTQDSLDNLFATLEKEIKDEQLELRHGEMRWTAIERGFNALLGAVISTRINLKLLNERAETRLVQMAEPLASLAMMLGEPYPEISLQGCWKYLLQNHAHDSICGAAIDQVHRDMLYRFSVVDGVTEEVAHRAMRSIFSRINLSSLEERDFVLVVFNTSGFQRRELVEAVIDIPDSWERSHFDIVDKDGTAVDFEIVLQKPVEMRVERRLDTAVSFTAQRHWVLLNIEVPPLGYTTYVVRPRPPRYVRHPEPEGRKLIASLSGRMENELIAVEINDDGTFDVSDKKSGHRMKGCHQFIDEGEVGFAHLTYRPQRDEIVSSRGSAARISLVENNRLRASYKIEQEMMIPAEGLEDRSERLEYRVPLSIVSWITVKKGSARVEIKTQVNNRARDHRLRVLFPTGVPTDSSHAESCFWIEERDILWADTGDNFEHCYPTKPMQNFVDISDGERGCAFLSQGLREYEVLNDEERTLAVTLLRTSRTYMTATTDFTREELERHRDSHQFGQLEFHYALYPHQRGWLDGEVIEQAYGFKVPLKMLQGCRHEGTLPLQHSFISIEPADKLVLSAVKKAEEGEALVIRAWNATAEKQKAVLHLGLPVKKVVKTRLDETPLEEIKFSSCVPIRLEFGAAEILTLRLELGE